MIKRESFGNILFYEYAASLELKSDDAINLSKNRSDDIMGIISSIMVKLLRAQPFESEDLDELAETMKAAPILKRDRFHRYYESRFLPFACVAYSDALVFNFSYYQALLPEEILAVGAHEFNHIAKNHAIKRLPRTFLPAAILAVLIGYLFSVNSALTNNFQLFFTFDRSLVIAFSVIFSMLFFLTISFYVNSKWLRSQETECDLSAMEFVNGNSIISALGKLRPNKNSGWRAKLFKLMPHTHPTIEERISDIQNAMKVASAP